MGWTLPLPLGLGPLEVVGIALAFDTHKAVKALREAGANEPLAEAVVTTVGEAIGGNVASKADLVEVKTELKTDLAALGVRLYRQLWVMAAGLVGLTVALMKLTA